jgi:hypothetical protein
MCASAHAEGIDYIVEINGVDSEMFDGLINHHDERVRESTISQVILCSTSVVWQSVMSIAQADSSDALRRVAYDALAKTISGDSIVVEDIQEDENKPPIIETILRDLQVRVRVTRAHVRLVWTDNAFAWMQHEDVSLAAVATHLLTGLIGIVFDDEEELNLKGIDELLSEGSPRYADLSPSCAWMCACVGQP